MNQKAGNNFESQDSRSLAFHSVASAMWNVLFISCSLIAAATSCSDYWRLASEEGQNIAIITIPPADDAQEHKLRIQMTIGAQLPTVSEREFPKFSLAEDYENKLCFP